MTPPYTEVAEQLRHHALALLAAAQNGLAYASDPYDRQRYEQVRRSAEELMSLVSDGELEQVRRIVALDSGYMTPKVDVRGGVFDASGNVLLVRERADGRWTLPGGWCDVLEAPSEAVERELREEAGIAIEVDKLVAVLDRDKQGHRSYFPFHVHKLFFLSSSFAGNGSESQLIRRRQRPWTGSPSTGFRRYPRHESSNPNYAFYTTTGSIRHCRPSSTKSSGPVRAQLVNPEQSCTQPSVACPASGRAYCWGQCWL